MGGKEEKARHISSDVPQQEQDGQRRQQNIGGKKSPSSPALEMEVSFAEATALDLLLNGLLREDEIATPLEYGGGLEWGEQGEGKGKCKIIMPKIATPTAGKSYGEEGAGGNNAAANVDKGGYDDGGGGDSDDEKRGGIVGRLFLSKREGRKGSSIGRISNSGSSKASPLKLSATAGQKSTTALSYVVDDDIQEMIRLTRRYGDGVR